MSIAHQFEPIYDKNSKILILGSFPSVKSRENNFYYGHPQNRFWKILEKIYNEKIENNIVSKKEFLLKHNIALWDVVYMCDIENSQDASIKNVIPNDIEHILKSSDIIAIYCNGKTAYNLFNKYFKKKITDIPVVSLPSSSPANAKFNLNKLVETWKKEIHFSI